jgi:PAS domain S-box-containing protein
MNYYACIPLGTFIINVFTWTYIYAQQRHTAVNSAYLTFAAFVAVWNLELFILWSPLPDGAVIPWERMTTTTGFIVVFLFLHFVYIFLDKAKDLLYYALLVLLLASTIMNIFTNYYLDGYVKYHWGVSLAPGTFFIPMVCVVFVIPVLLSLFILDSRRRTIDDKNVHKQIVFLMYGTGIFFMVSVTSDFILPHIFSLKDIIRLGVPGSFFQAFFTFLAVRKYNFLSIKFEEICNFLFVNLKDSVIITDSNEHIFQMNYAAQQLFNIEHSGERYIKVSDLFTNYSFQQNYKDCEEVLIFNNDQTIISLSQASVSQYNLDVGKILIIRDITEHKKAQRELAIHREELERLASELAEANVSLEQKVAERTCALQRANAQLQHEIIERQRAEDVMRQQRDWLEVTLASIGDAVIATDLQGRITLMNPAAEAVTGWTAQEAHDHPVAEVFRLVDEQTHQPVENPVVCALRQGATVHLANHIALITRDGRETPIADSAALIRSGNGVLHGAVVVFHDIAERRRLEEQLRQAQKMQAIGTLAGGIAHDFNNLLAAILGYTELVADDVPPGSHPWQCLQQVLTAGMRARELVQQLLTFSRHTQAERTPLQLYTLITEALQLLHAALPPAIEIRHDLDANTGFVLANATQMHQVVMNLCINAEHAMRLTGGILYIGLENVEVDAAGAAQQPSVLPGSYVRLTVQDTGHGMTREILERIYEPFFTTKGVGEGTGLGLSIVHGIVASHGGVLIVESHPGQGTTFALYLPRIE